MTIKWRRGDKREEGLERGLQATAAADDGRGRMADSRYFALLGVRPSVHGSVNGTVAIQPFLLPMLLRLPLLGSSRIVCLRSEHEFK